MRPRLPSHRSKNQSQGHDPSTPECQRCHAHRNMTNLNSFQRQEHPGKVTRVSENLGPNEDGDNGTFDDCKQVREFLTRQ